MNAICFEKEEFAESSHTCRGEKHYHLEIIKRAMRFTGNLIDAIFVGIGILATRRRRKAK